MATGGLLKGDMTLMNQELQLIALPDVIRITGLSKSEIWRRVRADLHFPKPVRLGDRCTRWSRGECLDWARDRLAERHAGLNVTERAAA